MVAGASRADHKGSGRVEEASRDNGSQVEGPMRKRPVRWAWATYIDRKGTLMVAMMSGAFVDTSSAFVNPMLGTRKDDPKARYSLLAHAIQAFESTSYCGTIAYHYAALHSFLLDTDDQSTLSWSLATRSCPSI